MNLNWKDWRNFIKMKTGHLILTRLAIKWIYGGTGLSWDEWLYDSIRLMDKYCRPSLSQQIDQDFKLLTFVDNSVDYVGTMIDNEHIISITNPKEEYPFQILVDAVNQFVRAMKYDAVIITRLDRDDCLRKDFIHNLKQHSSEGIEKYVDIKTAYTYSENHKMTYKSDRYERNFCSPFVSTYEIVKDGKIVCYPFAYMHAQVPDVIRGVKVNDLFAMQVIHDHNLSNGMHGEQTEIDVRDYF